MLGAMLGTKHVWQVWHVGCKQDVRRKLNARRKRYVGCKWCVGHTQHTLSQKKCFLTYLTYFSLCLILHAPGDHYQPGTAAAAVITSGMCHLLL